MDVHGVLSHSDARSLASRHTSVSLTVGGGGEGVRCERRDSCISLLHPVLQCDDDQYLFGR